MCPTGPTCSHSHAINSPSAVPGVVSPVRTLPTIVSSLPLSASTSIAVEPAEPTALICCNVSAKSVAVSVELVISKPSNRNLRSDGAINDHRSCVASDDMLIDSKAVYMTAILLPLQKS